MENQAKCQTCMGEGAIANEYGPQDCPDCCGLGRLPSASVLRERRIRELEQAHGKEGETGMAIRWLADEVRKANHVLMQILAAAIDTRENDPVVAKVRFLANEALGMYPVEKD